MHRLLLFLAVLAIPVGSALAEDVEISMAWARATPGVAANGVAYVTVSNHGAETAIVGAETPVAKRASLHTHIMDGDVMQMRPVERVSVAEGATVIFAPGGLHIMLQGLAYALKEGESFPLTLVFDDGSTLAADVVVAGIGAMMAPGHEMPHGKVHGDHETMMDDMEHMDAIDTVSGTGVVNAVNIDMRMVNLSHDPIPALGMPAMTMDMAVSDDVMLHGLNPGTSVDFTLVKGPDGIYQIGSVTARE